MKQVFAALSYGLLLLTACASPTPAPSSVLNSDAVAASLQTSGLPVVGVHVRTAETDPNKLLGRPNQYAGKVSWNDQRTIDPAAELQPDGKWTVKIADSLFPADPPIAAVELFASSADMESRFTSMDAFSKSSSLFAMYIFRNDARRALLYLPHELTPTQAEEYQRWLATL